MLGRSRVRIRGLMRAAACWSQVGPDCRPAGSPPIQQSRHTKTCLFQIVDQAPCSRRHDEVAGHPAGWRLTRVGVLFAAALLV